MNDPSNERTIHQTNERSIKRTNDPSNERTIHQTNEHTKEVTRQLKFNIRYLMKQHLPIGDVCKTSTKIYIEKVHKYEFFFYVGFFIIFIYNAHLVSANLRAKCNNEGRSVSDLARRTPPTCVLAVGIWRASAMLLWSKLSSSATRAPCTPDSTRLGA